MDRTPAPGLVHHTHLARSQGDSGSGSGLGSQSDTSDELPGDKEQKQSPEEIMKQDSEPDYKESDAETVEAQSDDDANTSQGSCHCPG